MNAYNTGRSERCQHWLISFPPVLCLIVQQAQHQQPWIDLPATASQSRLADGSEERLDILRSQIIAQARRRGAQARSCHGKIQLFGIAEQVASETMSSTG